MLTLRVTRGKLVSIRAPSGEDATRDHCVDFRHHAVSIRAPSGEDATRRDLASAQRVIVSIRAPSGEDATGGRITSLAFPWFQSARPRVRTRRE